ncbi:MAG TPA: alpha/beta hydrolase [Dermatophilaceae bacterium]
MSDPFPTGDLPSWLDQIELDRQADDLVRAGAAGALNRYRNMDRDWEDLATWDGVALHQPSLFLAGAHDASVSWTAAAIAAFPTTLPELRTSRLLESAGHWVHQERPDEVNELLVAFMRENLGAPRAAT